MTDSQPATVSIYMWAIAEYSSKSFWIAPFWIVEFIAVFYFINFSLQWALEDNVIVIISLAIFFKIHCYSKYTKDEIMTDFSHIHQLLLYVGHRIAAFYDFLMMTHYLNRELCIRQGKLAMLTCFNSFSF